MGHGPVRPYTICHILCSIDGRIDGAFMFEPAAAQSLAAYRQLQAGFEADAIAYGAVTTQGLIGTGRPELETGACSALECGGDFVAPGHAEPYYVSLDPRGELAWESGTLSRPGRPDAHVVELLCGSTPRPYRAYLRERGVSYVVAGDRELDLGLAVRKLAGLFGVERLLVCGGGVTDQAFLAAGLIDELSLVVAPLASGEHGVATVFDEAPFALPRARAFALDRAERVGADGLHLVYRRAEEGR